MFVMDTIPQYHSYVKLGIGTFEKNRVGGTTLLSYKSLFPTPTLDDSNLVFPPGSDTYTDLSGLMDKLEPRLYLQDLAMEVLPDEYKARLERCYREPRVRAGQDRSS